MLARTVAGMLSNKLETDVKIKTFHLTSDLGILAEDVLVNDKNDNPMFYIGRMKLRLGLFDNSDNLRLRQLHLDDVLAYIVEYDGHDSFNVVELFSDDNNEKKNKEKNDFEIFVDDFVFNNGRVMVWNQNKDNPDREGMDYRYIDVKDIYLDFNDLKYTSDTISAFINNISASDRCGFSLDTLRSDNKVIFSSKCLIFDDMTLKTHATSLNMDLRFYYENLNAYSYFVDSIKIDATFRPSQLTLSDLRFFTNTLETMTDTVQIEGDIDGYVRDFLAQDFKFSFQDSTNFSGNIKMTGLPNFFDTHIHADIYELNFTYEDLTRLMLPGSRVYLPLPDFLYVLKSASLSGYYEGFPNNFTTKFELETNLGNIKVDCNLNHDLLSLSKPYYYINLKTDSLNIKDLLGLDEDFTLTMNTDMHGSGFSKKDADFELDAKISHLKAFNNNFNDFEVNGVFENQRFLVSTDVKSEALTADLDAMANVAAKKPAFSINLSLKNADLHKLGLSKNDTSKSLSTDLKTSFKGIKINDLLGELKLENTVLKDNKGSYLMDNFVLSMSKNPNNAKYKDLNINCDFFDVNASGVINVLKATNTFKNLILNHFHIKSWAEKGTRLDDEVLDFYFSMNLKNTETLSKLLLPDLRISENTNLLINFTKDYYIHSYLHSDKLSYKDFVLNNLQLTNTTEKNKIIANINIEDLVLREATEKNPQRLSMENVNFNFDVHSDSVLFKMNWNDDDILDRNRGLLKAYYVTHDDFKGGMLKIPYTDVIINDSLWSISPDCHVNFTNGKTFISKLDIISGIQAIKIDGFIPKTNRDTLSIHFDNLDISSFDKLISNGDFVLDGIINGDLQIAGIKEKFTMLSNLDVYKIAVNHQDVGDADIDAVWNAPDSSIRIKTQVTKKINDNEQKTLSLLGKYYTSRDENLNFKLFLNDFDVSLINPFVKGTLSRVKGNINGDLSIKGSFEKPILLGKALLKDAACNIDVLNTYYRVNDSELEKITNDHYIFFKDNLIRINHLNLNDTLGNRAVAQGVITHNYLKDFYFDVSAVLDNFLGLNMLKDDFSAFYGSAIANGNLSIKGSLDDIYINIDAETMPGTDINILLTSTYSVDDNFIVFVQKDKKNDTIVSLTNPQDSNKKFTLNLNADVNPNANVNIHLPSNLGSIVANGNGNIRLGLNSDELSLYGDYVINSGDFNFSFQNIIKREFVIKEGGTISWTGRAEDADINITGIYKAKSSLTSLGAMIDTLSSIGNVNTNNVNVDCILRLQDKLTNPTINFGLSLPNANDDIKNYVFSVVDTTDQAVLSQQIISLLVLGTFTYSSANINTIGASTYYGVLTSSLSSWLSQISKDFDIGVRYTPKDNITQEELEVALSTQLFNDRLTIEGNLGMYTGNSNNMSQSANNIVGDVDITFKITNRLSLKVYNHSNVNTNYYAYTYENYSDYTQGIGISYSQSFDNVREIFTRKNRNKKNKKNNKMKKDE